jgi:hypothetical protein
MKPYLSHEFIPFRSKTTHTTGVKKLVTVFLVLFCVGTALAQLTVTVAPPKITGQKAVVRLRMENGFPEKVESARAAVFLIGTDGKPAAYAAQWVIGGTKDAPALAPGGTRVFNMVITAPKPFTTTNLTARMQFNRVVLEGGKLVDVAKKVTIEAKSR